LREYTAEQDSEVKVTFKFVATTYI